MNAVEIEEAVSQLASEPFDAPEFPFQFLKAFGNKDATISRLRSGASNGSDIPNGVLQRSNIHIATCSVGATTQALVALKLSPKTVQAKARYVLTTDGATVEAEDLATGETIACPYEDLPDRFAFFLPLAGISTIKQLRESSFDVRATGRLNKLYLELRRNNPSWDKADRQHDMNHFMARLIFCFFAEDTDIFQGRNLFSQTIEQMSAQDASNTHDVIENIFRAMNIKLTDRVAAKVPRWAEAFPYVNGGLFSGSTEVPKFTKMARIFLLHIGNLEWRKINPDIFGSMIQAVADDEERGALGMHYTSVPNILKVLNPLFLDDLRAKLEEAGDNARMLLNLRKRMSRIRVFDPACGSGNFLVIAYKQLREIEAELNKRRGEEGRKSDIPITNFRGIELRSFPTEIARLALIIAEFQCDTLHLGQKEALQEFLPLDAENWITCGNALRLDWLTVCPPTGSSVQMRADDLFSTSSDQSQIDFENDGGETYICGNPPYLGSTWQSDEQKDDLRELFDARTKSWKSLDYVCGWFIKAIDYGRETNTVAAFVTTNSICQGQQVPILWPLIFDGGWEISFAHTSFKWQNLASHNAGVTVIIVGISNHPTKVRRLFSNNSDSATVSKETGHINAYLVAGPHIIVEKASAPINHLHPMNFGNKPVDGGYLLLSRQEMQELNLKEEQKKRFIRRIYGSAEFIRGQERYCIWIEDKYLPEAAAIGEIKNRIDGVRATRLASRDKSAQEMATRAHQMREMNIGKRQSIIIPRVSSENRSYLPVGLIDKKSTITDACFALFDAPLWCMALLASRLHLIWIATVCGKLETRLRYSNTLGWNTFPVPTLTDRNKSDLARCAENILLAREAHFPATIADLYDPEAMPSDLRQAHEQNDEVLERIYIGRRFRNDTERLEKLFELYTEMVSSKTAQKVTRQKSKGSVQ